jgi:hypothetical protein
LYDRRGIDLFGRSARDYVPGGVGFQEICSAVGCCCEVGKFGYTDDVVPGWPGTSGDGGEILLAAKGPRRPRRPKRILRSTIKRSVRPS